MFVGEGGRHSGGNSKRVLSWFEAPNWIEHSINTPIGPFTGDSTLVDVDKDDDLDLVISADSHSGSSSSGFVYWYENTGNPFGSWTQHVIEANVPNAFHIGDMDTGDVDGDGKLDIVVRHLSTLRFVVYFQNSKTNWTPRRFDAKHREGLSVADIDGNNRADIIGNGYVLFAPTNARTGLWVEKTIDDAYFNVSQSGLNNSTKESIADMNGDGKPDIIFSSAEGQAVFLAWYENPSNSQTGNWIKHIIESPQGKNHQVQVADVDKDGDPDIFGGFSFGSKGVYWWENINGLATDWKRNIIDSEKGCYSCVAGDYDNDGDIDFAGPTKYVGNVYLYRNLLPTNNVIPPPVPAPKTISIPAWLFLLLES